MIAAGLADVATEQVQAAYSAAVTAAAPAAAAPAAAATSSAPAIKSLVDAKPGLNADDSVVVDYSAPGHCKRSTKRFTSEDFMADEIAAVSFTPEATAANRGLAEARGPVVHVQGPLITIEVRPRVQLRFQAVDAQLCESAPLVAAPPTPSGAAPEPMADDAPPHDATPPAVKAGNVTEADRVLTDEEQQAEDEDEVIDACSLVAVVHPNPEQARRREALAVGDTASFFLKARPRALLEWEVVQIVQRGGTNAAHTWLRLRSESYEDHGLTLDRVSQLWKPEEVQQQQEDAAEQEDEVMEASDSELDEAGGESDADAGDDAGDSDYGEASEAEGEEASEAEGEEASEAPAAATRRLRSALPEPTPAQLDAAAALIQSAAPLPSPPAPAPLTVVVPPPPPQLPSPETTPRAANLTPTEPPEPCALPAAPLPPLAPLASSASADEAETEAEEGALVDPGYAVGASNPYAVFRYEGGVYEGKLMASLDLHNGGGRVHKFYAPKLTPIIPAGNVVQVLERDAQTGEPHKLGHWEMAKPLVPVRCEQLTSECAICRGLAVAMRGLEEGLAVMPADAHEAAAVKGAIAGLQKRYDAAAAKAAPVPEAAPAAAPEAAPAAAPRKSSKSRAGLFRAQGGLSGWLEKTPAEREQADKEADAPAAEAPKAAMGSTRNRKQPERLGAPPAPAPTDALFAACAAPGVAPKRSRPASATPVAEASPKAAPPTKKAARAPTPEQRGAAHREGGAGAAREGGCVGGRGDAGGGRGEAQGRRFGHGQASGVQAGQAAVQAQARGGARGGARGCARGCG